MDSGDCWENAGIIDFDWIVEHGRLPEKSLQFIRDTIDICIKENKSMKIFSPSLIAELDIFPSGLILITPKDREENYYG